MKLSPDCALVTYQFNVGDEFITAITKSQDDSNRFTNFMVKLKGVASVTFMKFAGPYVWVAVNEPHGRFIVSHEVIHDALVLFAKKMI